jgi:hypothetical protein
VSQSPGASVATGHGAATTGQGAAATGQGGAATGHGAAATGRHSTAIGGAAGQSAARGSAQRLMVWILVALLLIAIAACVVLGVLGPLSWPGVGIALAVIAAIAAVVALVLR